MWPNTFLLFFLLSMMSLMICEPLIDPNGRSSAGILEALSGITAQDAGHENGNQLQVSDADQDENFSCYSCSTVDNPSCQLLNGSDTHPLPIKKCEPGERFCSVLRIEYKIPHQLYEWTLWTLERGCQRTCDSRCIQLGERTRVKYCHSCCTGSLCNMNNSAKSLATVWTTIGLSVLVTLLVATNNRLF